jgi:hypothetical protein
MSDPKPLANNNNAFGRLPPRAPGLRPRPAGTPALGGRTTISEENIGDFFFIVPTDNAGTPGLERPHKDQKVLGQLVSVITGGAIMPVPKFDVDGEMKFYPPNRYTFWTALWPVGARGGKRTRSYRKARKLRSRTRSRKYTRKHRGGRKMHLPENSFVYKFMNMYNGLRDIELDVIDAVYTRERRVLHGFGEFVNRARNFLEVDEASGAFRFDDESVTLGPTFSRFIQNNYSSSPYKYVMAGAMLDHLHGYGYHRD